MHLTVQGKQMDVGDALRTHVEEKLEDINRKYFNHATDATVTFSREGHGHGVFRSHVHIRVGRNIVVMADSEAGDAYGAFDKTAEKVATQLRRYKNRLRTHSERMQAAQAEILPALDYVISNDDDEQDDHHNEAADAGPMIIAEMTTTIRTLTVSDAVMRMDLENLPALLFRNPKHGELNMVYRRADGNVGWIDPAQNLGTRTAPPAAKKAPARKTAAKKPAAKKPATRKPAAKKPAAKKAPVKKAAAKNTAPKKPAVKKAPVKKAKKRG